MKRGSGGKDWLVSYCGDGDIVDAGEGDGKGVGEGGKETRK